MEQIMRIVYTLAFIVPATLGLTACGGSPRPQTTQVIVQPARTTVVPSAPMPPPPPMSELVPPPPVSSTPMVWQPGHWRYTGISSNPWRWENGQYVSVPKGATAWVPGQWQQQGSGWVWREGHWA
jgi:hypothetical protein